MSRGGFKTVREDGDVLILTTRSYGLGPHDLRGKLIRQVGMGNFKILLTSNTYIIYIDIRERKNDENRGPGSDGEETHKVFSLGPKTIEERALDIYAAERILDEGRF